MKARAATDVLEDLHLIGLSRRGTAENVSNRKGCDLGYALTADSLRKSRPPWMHVPSQPFGAITAFAVPNPELEEQRKAPPQNIMPGAEAAEKDAKENADQTPPEE